MMGRVSDMAIGLEEEARDELLCEIDHWKERADKTEELLRAVYELHSLGGFAVADKDYALITDIAVFLDGVKP